jgi:tRNA nucleotidyltransferase (CCA-adding enzyme)
VFGVPLVEDLARRDLIVNAIAHDQKHEIIDPFGGKTTRKSAGCAPGNAIERFTEDGLRVSVRCGSRHSSS